MVIVVMMVMMMIVLVMVVMMVLMRIMGVMVSGRWIVRSQSPGCYPIGSGKYRQGFVSRWVTDL